MLKGIDVSKHQGIIDWSKVRADFAIIRAGYGKYQSQADTQLKANMEGCKKHGIPVGVYWYSYATTVADAKLEAQTCLAVIKPYKDQIVLPVFFDQEYEKPIVALSNSARTEICKTFCELVKAAGYHPGIYASYDWFKNKLIIKQLTGYPFWVAQYGSKCGYTGDNLYMWQYSSIGKVDGIKGNVDMDEGYFTLPENGAKWVKDSKGWKYGDAKNCWKWLNGYWYWFDSKGYAVTGWQTVENKWYYFLTLNDGKKTGYPECSCMEIADE